ncbi:hypothetical protein GYMLUDRAFT_47408 [Collybiopsis luxurians FD-317 M1]|uniref:Sugar phosphate phosphatase n=1 Tax=Collybiopsis luxurians FD-317 M1 TaxID=944289 RepID=A0A0D0C1H7_9AGAR|nr:hypothetical protein GYMLUDRAFT_47408 [Collybiopsis luxurians FD-317 M1]
MVFQPPYPPYDPTDKSGFSYETVVKRWPIILAGIVDQLSRENHQLHLRSQDDPSQKQTLDAKITEGKAIIEKVSKLKYDMARDHVMEPIPADDELHVDFYNTDLEELAKSSKNTWFKAPWLYAECYLYRLLRSYFVQSAPWRDYDPFHSQKLDVFTKSGPSIYGIATIMHELASEKGALESDPAKIKVFFQEMIQMCLWGNATDLSLLTHMSLVDIEKLQSVGKEMQAARKEFIMRDDQEKAWEHLITVKNGRVDIVLDNAGFELFTDLVFADFLVTYTPYVSKVVFHPKLIPWFVSDVTPPDFNETIESLLDPSFLSSTTSPVPSAEQQQHLQQLADRLKKYVADGVFSLSVPKETPLGGASAACSLAGFWTTPVPYWDMETYDPELWKLLKGSDLVIFKGDLNYRKLTGDIQWPAWTPLDEALGPLARSFPLLSLRTNKADVAVGLDREIVAQTEAKDAKWRVNGKFAFISFLGK